MKKINFLTGGRFGLLCIAFGVAVFVSVGAAPGDNPTADRFD
jgi:hypothetical protein